MQVEFIGILCCAARTPELHSDPQMGLWLSTALDKYAHSPGFNPQLQGVQVDYQTKVILDIGGIIGLVYLFFSKLLSLS